MTGDVSDRISPIRKYLPADDMEGPIEASYSEIEELGKQKCVTVALVFSFRFSVFGFRSKITTMTTPKLNGDDPAPLISFESATLLRPDGSTAFRDYSWQIRQGETWAIVGPTGSGKTSLIESLRGRYRLESGSLTWPMIDRLRSSGRSVGWPSEVIGVLSFKEESRLFSYGRHYYQQRFNFIEAEDDLSLDAFLRSGTSASEEAIQRVARRLGVEGLLRLSFIKLSNGQTRRARIAKIMLSHPELLILDEPFMGLDSAGRTEVADILGALIQQGTRILLITRPETIPEWVTHVLELGIDGPAQTRTRAEWWVAKTSATVPRAEWWAPKTPPALQSAQESQATPIIELSNVNVAYNDKPILRDISWTVQSGERWAVLGPNGSGKTTLLSLLCGDHPQAYRNEIRLFGQQRGTGESIWDIKCRIGLVSPELHLYFSEPLTVAKTVATGFHDVLTYRAVTTDQQMRIRQMLEAFAIDSLADSYFARLSTGQQRLVLFLRALVKQPQLLILDEPFQGMDTTMIARARQWLDEQLSAEQTLLFVSHYEDEIPQTVSRWLRLAHGAVHEIS
jgi:molybdate transport system ATP-binding protein